MGCGVGGGDGSCGDDQVVTLPRRREARPLVFGICGRVEIQGVEVAELLEAGRPRIDVSLGHVELGVRVCEKPLNHQQFPENCAICVIKGLFKERLVFEVVKE